MMLRGGTAPFQIELADGKAYLKKRDCVGSVRGIRKWKTTITGCYGVLGGGLERWQSSAITDIKCEDRGIAQLIYILNVDCKIELISLTVSVDYVYGVHLNT